ncbi:conserved membrane hypothetical protein [Hyella patelloides LEGE 07179]|uniref:DUF4079 domain-containing protein n=1 Tax=Hyella patelloides LEGE 07179 TaxID=945734 RepID=A0A563VPU6_9CYAN|nr:DUF4079 domain-containing protein [Hyella patelloides]VEP13424.1 conserved membrane hypothetical protein [Hyella patelloides LEGE 07179]
MDNLTEILKPIADWFGGLGTPEPIVHWGHPFFMSIVVFVMGSFVALAGWRSRQLAVTDPDGAIKNKADHRKIAPLMYIFLASGYTGGLLSLVMQNQPILESPHFWTGSVVIILLTINAVIAATGFIGNKETLRTVHAYVGSLALVILVFHAVLGLKLGLSI